MAATASAGRTPSAPAAQVPSIRGEAEGETLDLRSGTAEWRRGGLEIRLADHEVGCADTSYDDRLSFEVPRGPKGAFSTGRDVNVWVQLNRSGPSYYGGLDPHHAVAKLEPFEAKKGARVRGKLSFERRLVRVTGYGADEVSTPLAYRGSGSFDVELCADAPEDRIGDEDPAALSGKLGGTWSGKPLRFFEGLATVEVEPDGGATRVGSLRFPIGEAVDCAALSVRPFAHLDLSSMGGVARGKSILGAAQRVSVGINFAKGDHSYLFDQNGSRAWVRFDQLGFEEGDEIAGTLAALSAPGEKESFRVLGRFKARICPAR
ncbi:MAG TPA: hypothetical protein VGK67_36870 [Myxococcales bacterium]